MKGIDCSHYQNGIRWNEVKGDGVDFVIIKATQGIDYTDPALKGNAIEAHKAGIPISFYHYASLNTHDVITDAKNEAINFVNAIKNLPKNDFPLALDIEENKGELTKQEVQAWIVSFLNQMSALGYHDIYIYSYASFLDSNLPKDHPFGANKLWLACYRPIPTLPYGWLTYDIWQYSQRGTIKGIKGFVDTNRTEKPIISIQ